MSDDYLWDGSGEPDPEVQRLERLLERFREAPAVAGRRHTAAAASSDAGAPQAEAEPQPLPAPLAWRSSGQAQRPSRRRFVPIAGAIAATVILAVAGIGILRRGGPGAGGWEVVALAGEPTLASRRMATSGMLRPGEWIETDGASRAEIKIGHIGTAQIEPGTRVRLLQAGTLQHRLGLARGTLHARIWAPPRLFFVETPSAVAVDLGCAYTLTVDDEGGSRLRVESGWVAFEDGGNESFVPAGAVCHTRPGRPPGTPYFEDAAPAFIEALSEIDAAHPADASAETETEANTGVRALKAAPGGLEAPGRAVGDQSVAGSGGVLEGGQDAALSGVAATALGRLLDAARPRDALTLWHLLSRTANEERAQLFDRMAQLVPPPSEVTRSGILAGDGRMVDLWWDELHLGVTSWWRLWKQQRPPRVE